MTVKFFQATCIALLLLNTTVISHAGIDRFWTRSKNNDTEEKTQSKACKHLTQEQQQQLISTYQTILDDEKDLDLKKRMDWFCNLSNDEQQRMRLAWQNMSIQEREALKERLKSTSDLQKRAEIRREIIAKYSNIHE